jgi:transposase
MNKQRESYESDLTDEEWNFIQRLIPKTEANKKKGGRPLLYERREIVNAILYVVTSGCRWIDLPHDLPKKSITWKYFDVWSKQGIWMKVNKFLNKEYRKDLKKRQHRLLVSLTHKLSKVLVLQWGMAMMQERKPKEGKDISL